MDEASRTDLVGLTAEIVQPTSATTMSARKSFQPLSRKCTPRSVARLRVKASRNRNRSSRLFHRSVTPDYIICLEDEEVQVAAAAHPERPWDDTDEYRTSGG